MLIECWVCPETRPNIHTFDDAQTALQPGDDAQPLLVRFGAEVVGPDSPQPTRPDHQVAYAAKHLPLAPRLRRVTLSDLV